MANRFARRIRSGDIDSVEELKAEFKELAKLSHPDLAGPGADHGAFAELRSEYEDALRDFVKYRFGARGMQGGSSGGPTAFPGGLSGAAASGPLSDTAWACLELFLKRGFPKAPRHEKEVLRYEYSRWRLAEELGPVLAESLAGCEAELLALGTEDEDPRRRFVGFLEELADYRARGLGAMRTHLLLTFGQLAADPRIGRSCLAFARGLARDLGLGMEIPSPPQSGPGELGSAGPKAR